MSDFVNAGQIDDRVAKQAILCCARCERFTHAADSWRYIDGRSLLVANGDALHLSELSLAGGDPPHNKKCVGFVLRRCEFQVTAALPGPCFESEHSKFLVADFVSGNTASISNEIRCGFGRVRRLEQQRS